MRIDSSAPTRIDLAGGGGCLFCLIEPGTRPAVVDALAAGGATVLPFTFEAEGLEVVRS